MSDNEYSRENGLGESRKPIPDKTLAKVLLTVRELKTSKSNGTYASVELTIQDGPFAGRKVFTSIGDPKDPNNVNEANRAIGKGDMATMGRTAIIRCHEAAGLVNYNDASDYPKQFTGRTFAEIMQRLEGKIVAVKISLKPPQNGYDEKNEVGEWLSPNPDNGAYYLWEKLVNSETDFGTPVPAVSPRAAVLRPEGSVPSAAPKAGAWLVPKKK